jgi:hypothetical protein
MLADPVGGYIRAPERGGRARIDSDTMTSLPLESVRDTESTV